jgi:voltage-gated potassium channel
MEEFLIHPQSCPFVGATLAEAEIRTNSGALVLAIRRADGSLIGGPTGETELRAGDLLICMGTAEQLRLLNQILAPMQTSSFRQPYQQ